MSYNFAGVAALFYCKLRARQRFVTIVIIYLFIYLFLTFACNAMLPCKVMN